MNPAANCELVLADFGLARVTPAAIAASSSGSSSTASGSSQLAGEPGTILPASPPEDAEGGGMTSYVVTRWYRAPELLAGATVYDGAVDMWSVGCILGEMLGRKALFRGRSHAEQLQLIVSSIGVSGLSAFTTADTTARTTSRASRSSRAGAGAGAGTGAEAATTTTTHPTTTAAAPARVSTTAASSTTEEEWLRSLPAYKFVKSAAAKNGGKPVIRDWASVYPAANKDALE